MLQLPFRGLHQLPPASCADAGSGGSGGDGRGCGMACPHCRSGAASGVPASARVPESAGGAPHLASSADVTTPA